MVDCESSLTLTNESINTTKIKLHCLGGNNVYLRIISSLFSFKKIEIIETQNVGFSARTRKTNKQYYLHCVSVI